jgi:capsular exopolysaccharide synthesis family protein
MVFQSDERDAAIPSLSMVQVDAERTTTTLRGLGYGKELPAASFAALPANMDEIFRRAYTRAGVRGSTVLAICSAIVGEGKTTISLGLATTFAQDFPERRVALVETDIERPILARELDLDPTPGLVECLLDDHPIQVAYRATSLENLHVVPAGAPISTASRILRSNRMAATVDAIRQTHDLVILDGPAVLVNSDARPLTELADGVMLVVRAGVTPRSHIKRAVAEIDGTALCGVVLNGASSPLPRWLRRLLGLS